MTDLSSLIERVDDLDTCVCGDYRRDHVDGHGPCRFNGRIFDPCHADQDCNSFRLESRALSNGSKEGT
jgi:hypothetical protein